MLQVQIDPTICFELPHDRKAIIDAWDFDEFMQDVWKRKGHDTETGELDGEGKPKTDKALQWADIETEVRAWFKTHCEGIELKRSECQLIWKAFPDAFAKKKASWDAPQQNSPTSPPSTDPRFSD